MATVPAEIEGPSDADLINAVRGGTVSAYGSLYERHVASAYNLARQLSRSPAEADDLVSEAFAKVLDTLRAGRGPDSSFRAYLLTALRHTAYDKTRRDRKVELSDDVEAAGGAALAQPFSDTAVAGLERSLAARAFARLPERWQAVLWHTEIEAQSPAEVAPILGLTPNGVSALAYRAREGLRQAYLQVHLAETVDSRCRAAAEKLGAWTRGGLAKREKAQVDAHLDGCARCRALAAELADVNGAMRGFVAPLVLGIGTVGYLAATGTAKTAVVAAGAAGAAAGGAAGAAASAPRQLVGVAASSVALVAAVVVGLTAGGGNPTLPEAAPVTTAQPAPPTQAPPPEQPPPAPPERPAPPPEPPVEEPPVEEPPAPQPPAPPVEEPPVEPPVEEPPVEEPPVEEPPVPADLTAQAPSVPVGLVAGGDPADLPIVVTNSGGTLSEPVSAVLNLPPGVTAVPAGTDGFAAAPLLRLDAPRAARQPAAGTVACPGGTGTVTCVSPGGLAPDESVTLLFRVQAIEGTGGEITGTVTAGSAVNLGLRVRVDVAPPPVHDGVEVTAAAKWVGLLPGIWQRPTLVVRVENTGTSSLPVTVRVDRPGRLLWSGQDMDCPGRGSIVCTSEAELAPGEKLKLVYELNLWQQPGREDQASHRVVTVDATLGTASDSATVVLKNWHWPPVPAESTRPTGSSSAPPPATDPTEEPTGEPTGEPTREPSTEPTGQPTGQPTGEPSTKPSRPPVESPSTQRPPVTGTSRPPSSERPPVVDTPAPPTGQEPGRSDPPPGSGGGLSGLLDWLLGGRGGSGG